jgi:hypothetical protein
VAAGRQNQYPRTTVGAEDARPGQPPVCDHEGGKAQIGFGLAAAGRRNRRSASSRSGWVGLANPGRLSSMNASWNKCIQRSHMGIIKGSTIVIILAALSFLIYVCTVFALPQQRDNPFNVERTSLAAAVSNIVYTARLGRIYSGALEGFFATIERPLRQVLDEWPPDRQRGNLVGVSTDGNGVGYVLAATIAMRFFGLHANALPLFTAALMGLSALLLLWRFHGDLAGLVVLYFCSLTVLLFTMLVWDPAYAEQIAVGGIRYFSLVAILPAFHLLFDLLDPPAGEADPTTRNNLLLGAQATILLFAVLVRTSAGSLIGAIVLVWLLMAWRSRGNTSRLRMVMRKGAVVALVGIGFAAIVVVSAPGYANSGRFSSVLWHRVVASLSANPAWPFGDVAQMYECPPFPGAMQEGWDSVGGCIWWDYTVRHDMSEREFAAELYGGQYEAVMRGAFIEIARRYPGDVFKTFFYYKPRVILPTLRLVLRTKISVFPPLTIGLLVAALGNMFVCLVGPACVLASERRRMIVAVALLFTASTIPPYLVAWANPGTIADLAFYSVFGAGLALGALSLGVRTLFGRQCS